MKRFSDFIKEADVPANVTGAAVSTDKPVVTRKASNKYKKENEKEAPKLKVQEADYNLPDASYTTPDESGLYVMKNTKQKVKRTWRVKNGNNRRVDGGLLSTSKV